MSAQPLNLCVQHLYQYIWNHRTDSPYRNQALSTLLACVALGGDVWTALRSTFVSCDCDDALIVFSSMISALRDIMYVYRVAIKDLTYGNKVNAGRQLQHIGAHADRL